MGFLKWKRGLFPHFLAALAYLLLLLILLGPVRPFTEAWGENTADFADHLSLLWWRAQEASEGNLFPIFTHELSTPDGGFVFPPDPIGATVTIPLVWLLGSIAAYNFLIVADIVFACWAMFWLVRRRTGDSSAAFLAGAFFGMNPMLLGNIHSGVTEILQAGWLPLFVGLLLETLDASAEGFHKRKRFASIAGVSIVWWLVAMGQWYYCMYSCLAFAIISLVFLIQNPKLRVLSSIGMIMLFYFILILPVALIFNYAFSSDDSLFYLGAFPIKNLDCLTCFVADPADFFSSNYSCPGSRYLHFVYIGYTALFLLTVSLMKRLRDTVGWVLLSLFFLILALGPILYFDSKPVTLDNNMIFLPYYWFYKIIPFFDKMRLPYRFIIMFYLFAALAIGVGWSNFRWKRWPAVLFSGLVLMETVFLSGAPWPMTRHTIEVPVEIRDLALNEDDFCVFELPIRSPYPTRKNFIVNMIFHKHRIPYSLKGGHFGKSLEENLVFRALLLAEGTPGGKISPELQSFLKAGALVECLLSDRGCNPMMRRILDRSLKDLIEWNITCFILHKSEIADDSDLQRFCRALFGPPTLENDRLDIYFLKKDGVKPK